jgi:hypothetical protein
MGTLNLYSIIVCIAGGWALIGNFRKDLELLLCSFGLLIVIFVTAIFYSIFMWASVDWTSLPDWALPVAITAGLAWIVLSGGAAFTVHSLKEHIKGQAAGGEEEGDGGSAV